MTYHCHRRNLWTLSLIALLFTGGGSGCTDNPAPPPDPGYDGGTRPCQAMQADPGEAVLQHHKHPSRDGLYVSPTLTRAAAKSLQKDATFNATMDGPTYAQPLYLPGAAGGKDLLLVVTEQNQVTAFDAGSGAPVWRRPLGSPDAKGDSPCGNIVPLGITGTPVIDPASRTLFLGAVISSAGSRRHMLFALSVDDGSTRPGWPVDVEAKVPAFDTTIQNQRGALLLLCDHLYVPYGGHSGDCGPYRGWVLGVSLSDPGTPRYWFTRARGGGAWAPGGLASDGSWIYVATGNTFGAKDWSDGEAIIRLGTGPSFSQKTADYFTPTDWKQLDDADLDIGGSGPVLLDMPGVGSGQLVVALGKNGKAYLLDRRDLGGVSEGLASEHVASNEIINAAATYTTAAGTYVVFRGQGQGMACPGGAGDLTALRVLPMSPPKLKVAWCASQMGQGSPMVTTTDGRAEAVVWSVGAEGDNRLHGFDGDTGQVLFAGGGPGEAMTMVRRFQTPIAARGRIFVAADNRLYAFAPK